MSSKHLCDVYLDLGLVIVKVLVATCLIGLQSLHMFAILFLADQAMSR